MIRPYWCIHLSHTGRCPHNSRVTKFLLTNVRCRRSGIEERRNRKLTHYPLLVGRFAAAPSIFRFAIAPKMFAVGMI